MMEACFYQFFEHPQECEKGGGGGGGGDNPRWACLLQRGPLLHPIIELTPEGPKQLNGV